MIDRDGLGERALTFPHAEILPRGRGEDRLPREDRLDRANVWRCYWRGVCRSYPLARPRRSSRDITRKMTPIHDPANMEVDFIRHDEDMKPRCGVSFVCQF